MSFEDVEESISKLKNITEAGAIRKENQTLSEKLEIKKREHRSELDEKIAEINNLKMVIKQKDREIGKRDSVRIKYNKGSYSPKAFGALIDKKFDEKVEEEITKRAVERWEREAPQLIREALQKDLTKYPGSCMPQTRRLVDSTSNALRDKLLKNRGLWPPWFQEFFKMQVQTGITGGLDAEFTNSVEDKAQSRLNELTNIAWPRYVTGTANRFFKHSLTEQLKNLMRPIRFSCDKCGAEYEETLRAQDIVDLLKKPVIKFTCTAPGCRDFLRPHGIPLSLAEVILQLERPVLHYVPVEQGTAKGDNGVSVF